MRFVTLAVAGALLAWSSPAATQVSDIPGRFSNTARVLTLVDVLRLAEDAPALKTRLAQFAAAEGARIDASAPLFNNPQLSLDAARHDLHATALPGERWNEWTAGVAQTIEIAGQPGHRRDSADAAVSALRSDVEATRRQVRADAAQQFYRVLALQQRVELERQAVALFDRTAEVVQRRRAAGEDTRLDANVAAVEAERARNQLSLAGEQLLDARSELATRLQLTPEMLPEVSGDLAERVAAIQPLDRLLESIDSQPRLQALQGRENSARARLNLERARRYPDVTVGLSVGREGPGDARERVTMLSVAVPLPIFNQNATGIGQATSELTGIEIERQAAQRDLRAQVRALWTKTQSLQQRVQRLQGSMLPTLADNEQLSIKSQQAGQIGLLELIVVNRQALDARRDLIDALNDYQAARIALELAAGQPLDGGKP